MSERERKAKSDTRAGLLFVVSCNALKQYEYLKRIFANDKRVTVILDRRSGERRKTPSNSRVERRRADRRSRPAIEERLRRKGWAMVRVELLAAPPSPVPPTPVSVEPIKPVKSILVVDDDPMVARLLRDILVGDGHRVALARNGVEALALLAGHAFDLLLVDIRMPELDGPGFYRELERRNSEHARRVMFMTGGTVDAETAELLSTTRTPLLRKPLEVNEISATVQRFFLAAGSFRRRG
jgi:CheY-like chemotaxis protein